MAGSTAEVAVDLGSTGVRRSQFLQPVPEDPDLPLAFLNAGEAGVYLDGSCVAILRTRAEVEQWLREPAPGVEWLQIEGLIGDPEVWALAAQGQIDIPLDVILDDPATEFSALYRLVDVRLARSVRVSIPAKPGLMKALRMAASLSLPVRILPGQPDRAVLEELGQAADFYLHDSMVESPIEPFHSMLASFRGNPSGTLWGFLEQDPATFSHRGSDGQELHACGDVGSHLAGLLAGGAECTTCRWQPLCAGYFKEPDPAYSCDGVKALFATVESAADQIGRELADQEAAPTS